MRILGAQRLVFAAGVAIVLAVSEGRGVLHSAGRTVAGNSAAIMTGLTDAGACVLAVSCAVLALLAARAVLAARGLHYAPPAAVPVPVPVPAAAEPEPVVQPAPQPVYVPARPGQPAFSYRLRPPVPETAHEDPVPAAAQPWPDRENL